MTEGWGHPKDAAGFARLWRTEVEAAQALGRRVGSDRYLELRYEDLVRDSAAELARVCAFAGLEFEADMLDYVGRSDSARKPHQQRLNQPPTAGVRDWRTELDPADEAAFEDAAGELLAALGYETRSARPPVAEGSPRARGLPRDDHRLARRRVRDAALAALAPPASAARLTRGGLSAASTGRAARRGSRSA